MGEVDYARIFDVLPSPFMVVDKELRYIAANRAYLETTGRSFDEIAGQKVFELFPNPGESGDRLRASIDKVMATGQPDTLAYLAYPISRSSGGEVENRYWTAVHVPVLDADGSVKYVMQNTVDVTEFARIRAAATVPFTSLSAETRLIERTREVEAANADFRRLFQQAPAFFAILSGPTHVFTFASDSYLRLVGGRRLLGCSVGEAMPEVRDQGFIELLDRVFVEGYVHQAEGARLMLVRDEGKAPEETFLDFSYHPIRDPSGEITGVFVQGTDRTESVRAARRQRLLIDELNHRVNNTLATVQSIAAQTLRSTADTIKAREAFQARIQALSKAHSMLSDRSWHDTEIGRLVCQELSAYEGAQVRYAGPELVVNSKCTIALALLLHELATNAAKHGALSVPDGVVAVSWREDPEKNLVLEWSENGGPAVSAPSRRGFGSRLLDTVVTGELGGQLDVRYEPKGIFARLVIPPAAYIAQELALG
ncbi:PAS domain-containing protein [Devosia sp. BK]|uniref:sensor histidine kinase n=1 Tax=Devosia sp. BK TaxID=2871706 RepID=UPI00293A3B93|nr:PAS domain-containing protein [Devosia sp. BK]MDV3250322.1 PAS domain-containing protein [Devosia sp. BK]